MARDVRVRLPTPREAIPDSVREDILRRVGSGAIEIIKERTARGIDVDGAAFPAYSADYARLKQEAGRGTNVNLTVSGEMLASMQVTDVTPERAVLRFTGSGPQIQFHKTKARKGTKTGQKVTRAAKTTTARVSNALKAAAIHKGLGHHPARRFFAISEVERGTLLRIAVQAIPGARVR